MTQSIMEWTASPTMSWIDFDVRLKGDNIISQLAFVVLLAAKFDGEITPRGGSFKRGDGYVFGSLRVDFENRERQQDAKAHCSGHLDGNGVVNASYVGALENADPGLRQARSLRERIGSKKSN